MKPANEIFKLMEKQECRQIVFNRDPSTGMSAILVVDSIPNKRDKNGKLKNNVSVSGGTRFAHKNPDDALNDALRLSKAMTRKCQVLGINEGGAKAVVLDNSEKDKNFLESVGDFIQLQKGLFKTAIDLGFDLKDAEKIFSRTEFIDSLSHNKKGLGSTGENTAEGMIHGFEVISKRILNKPLKECRIAVQGFGAVGMALTKRLVKTGCKVIATDINRKLCDKAKKLGIKIVKPKEIFSQEVDIFSPCAFGGVINDDVILKLKCKVVAGGANNQLKDEIKTEKQLLNNGIIFIPDFVLNCSGFLQALVERNGGTVKEAREKSKIVAKKISEVIDFSEENNCTLLEAGLNLFSKEENRIIRRLE